MAAFAFYPRTTLIVCTAVSVVVLAALGFIMAIVPRGSAIYDIFFALTTGTVGSFFVSIVVELSGNYKNNRLAWYELQDYYYAVIDYEMHKQILMQHLPHQRAERKAHDEYAAQEPEDVTDDIEKPKDMIEATWKELPKIMPVFRKTLEDKKAFLNNEEIQELEKILAEYRNIRYAVNTRLMMSPMLYNALNHPDQEYLKCLYPQNILCDMPEWIRKHLASEESRKAIDQLTDAILSDDFLLAQYMKDYDISQHGLDSYHSSFDDEIGVPEETDREEYDFSEDSSEPEDEETYKRILEESDRQMEEEERPFVSWHISQCCLNISGSIDILEQNILKKPYYGLLLKFDREAEKHPLDDKEAAGSAGL